MTVRVLSLDYHSKKNIHLHEVSKMLSKDLFHLRDNAIIHFLNELFCQAGSESPQAEKLRIMLETKNN